MITVKKTMADKTYPLLTLLIGLISFLISGIITGLIGLSVNEGLILVLGIPIGSLLMSFILGKLTKDKVLSIIIRSELGGLIGILVGFIMGALLGGGVAFIFPSLSDLSQVNSQIIPNIIVLIIADAAFGAFMASLFYHQKSISFFALVCGISSVPFGILLSMPINVIWIGFDQNLLFILTSFGTTTGLSIGLYNLLKIKINVS